jgi:hypothetical protein
MGPPCPESGLSPHISKLNRQDCQESRLETENREGPKTLGRVLDSHGLSKTVGCAGLTHENLRALGGNDTSRLTPIRKPHPVSFCKMMFCSDI